jgi:hypothetical protein
VATGGDRVASPSHGREEGADGWGPLVRERDREGGECGLTGWAEPTAGERRERERGGAADGWGRDVSGGRARGDGLLGPRKGGECGRAREREEAYAGSSPVEVFFLFPFFLFLISIFYFYLFYLLFF